MQMKGRELIFCAFILLQLVWTGHAQQQFSRAQSVKDDLNYLAGAVRQAETCVRGVTNTKLPQIASMINKLGQVHRDAVVVRDVAVFIYNIAEAAAFGLLGPFALPIRNEFRPLIAHVNHILNRVQQIYFRIRGWAPALLVVRDNTNRLINNWKRTIKEILQLGRNITTNVVTCFGITHTKAVGAVQKLGQVIDNAAEIIETKELNPYRAKISKAIGACDKIQKQPIPNVDDEIKDLQKLRRKLDPIHGYMRKIKAILDTKVCLPNPLELARELTGRLAEKARENAGRILERTREHARRIIRLPRIRIRFRRWGKRKRRDLDPELELDDVIEIDKKEAVQFLKRDKRASLLCVKLSRVIRGGGGIVGKLVSKATGLLRKLISRDLTYNILKKTGNADLPRKLVEARNKIDSLLNCINRLPIKPSDVTQLMDYVLRVQAPLQCPRRIDQLITDMCYHRRITSLDDITKIRLPQECENLKVYVPPQIKDGLKAFDIDFKSVCRLTV